MVSINSGVLILFGLAAALAFFFPLWKDAVYKQMSLKPLISRLPAFLLAVVPVGVLFGLAAYLGVNVIPGVEWFAAAALCFYLLSGIGLTVQLTAVVLLVLSVLLTIQQPAEGATLSVAAVIMGLLVAKVADALLLSGRRSIEDILAPTAWLAGVLWLSTFEAGPAVGVKQSLLLGTIAVCLSLRVISRPFMTDDRWFLKRLVLASSGGLGVLLVITKLLLAVDLAPLALLAGAGMLATYIFQNIPADKDAQTGATTNGINLLIVVGVLTLVATRLFGIFGLVMLMPAALLPPRFSLGQFIGLYFLVRVAAQVFIQAYNSNVTGINLTHSYTGAAQYCGFIALGALLLVVNDIKDKRILAAVMLAAGTILPMMANYYLHAEPASSLLVSAAVAGVICVVLGPALKKNAESVSYETLLILPALMSSVAITFSGLLEAGDGATNEFKTTVLASCIGGVVIVLLAAWLLGRYLGKGKPAAATGE